MIEVASKEKQLKKLEDEIAHSFEIAKSTYEQAKNAWKVIARDLWKIREGKLYPQQKFGQYSWQRWGLKERHALQLCRLFELLKDDKKCDIPHFLLEDSSISQQAALELTKTPPEYREEVLEDAKKSGPPTEKSVKKAAAKRTTSVPDTIEKDREGRDIPEPAMAIWNRRNELKPYLSILSELKQWATDMQDNQDLLYVDLKFNDLVRQIEVVATTIKRGVPHAVCTKCQGDSAKIFHCDFCKGRGMISAYQYHGMPYTPEEMKKIIEKRTSKNDKSEKLSSTASKS